jgi:hypothetical protein
MPRLHSETFLLLALAAFSKARNSSAVTRTRRNLPFDVPLGSFGRPGFLGLVWLGTLFELLHDCCLYSGFWRHSGRNMEHGHMAFGLGLIACIVHPGTYSIGLGMAR